MELFQVRLEAHRYGATLYIFGFLADLAAARAEIIIAQFPIGVRVVRVDLRGVQLIDSTAFVRVARSLRRWRDLRRGRVTIEYPALSAGSKPSSLHLVRTAGDTTALGASQLQ